ncbi:MAG: hypothetical protein V3T81_03715, partial [Thermoanaerobaculia bacterium]
MSPGAAVSGVASHIISLDRSPSPLRSARARFVLVAGPGEERIPDTLFFARRLTDVGYHLGPIVV